MQRHKKHTPKCNETNEILSKMNTMEREEMTSILSKVSPRVMYNFIIKPIPSFNRAEENSARNCYSFLCWFV